MQDENQALVVLQIALLDLEYIISDISTCAHTVDRNGQITVQNALSQIEAAKRDLIKIAYPSQRQEGPRLH